MEMSRFARDVGRVWLSSTLHGWARIKKESRHSNNLHTLNTAGIYVCKLPIDLAEYEAIPNPSFIGD
jgi:hypothetical protein